MLYRGFPANPSEEMVHRVPSDDVVDPLLNAMQRHGIPEVWGLHTIPCEVGKRALFPVFEGSCATTYLAVLSAQTSPEFPDQINVGLTLADSRKDRKVGRPLHVPAISTCDFSRILQRDVSGFDSLVCSVGPVDVANGGRDAVLLGENGAGQEPVEVRVGSYVMKLFLGKTAIPLLKDIRTLYLMSRMPKPS